MSANKYRVTVTNRAQKDLSYLEKSIAERIVKKLEYFESLSSPLDYAESLRIPFYGKYRFRIGEYRVIFTVEPSGVITILLVLSIRHRKDIYR